MIESKGRKTGGWIFRAFMLAAFAMWFGGLGFYMAWVVPIGTDELGSAFDQGMITRRVTTHINVLAGVALLLMLVDAIGGRNMIRWQKRTKLATVLFMLAMLAVLVWVHPKLDAHINMKQRTINDYEAFYFLHRVYLWVTTAQWLTAWVWLGAYVWQRLRPDESQVTEQG